MRSVLSFILTINDFNIIYVMTRGGPGTATQVLATYSYEVAFNQLRWGRGVTIAIFRLLWGILRSGRQLVIRVGAYGRRPGLPREENEKDDGERDGS